MNLTRRVVALEAGARSTGYAAMSDDELQAEMLRVRAQLEDGGLEFPPDYDEGSLHKQGQWLAEEIRRIECET